MNADGGEEWRREERVAEVVQQMVTLSIDDARLHDRVVEAGIPYTLLGLPLRFVICGPTPRAGTKKAEQDQLVDAGAGGRPRDHFGSADVHVRVALSPTLAVDSRAVRDCLAAAEGRRQRAEIRDVGADERDAGRTARTRVAAVHATRNHHDLVSLVDECRRQVTTHETGAAGDHDPHRLPPRAARRRRAICVGQTALRKSPSALARLSGSRL